MTDKEIIQGLIERDERITLDFFFRRCPPLIYALITRFYPSGADYDELVNELYVHLMEDDARRLRMYEGRSSVYKWLKMVATNYFLDKKKRERVIENNSHDSLLDKAKETVQDSSDQDAGMNIAAILDQVDNEKYRLVIQKLVIEGMSFDELEKITGINKANLYNIKSRAMKALEKIAKIARVKGDALCAVLCEEYILHRFGIHKHQEELQGLAESKGWLSEDGAQVEDLGNTSAYFGLTVEKLADADLSIIARALDDGKQVIAAVDGGELIGDPLDERLEDVFVGGIVDHCVVVLSVDIKADEVALFDPAFGTIPLTVTVAHFLDAWADSDYYCIVVCK